MSTDLPDPHPGADPDGTAALRRDMVAVARTLLAPHRAGRPAVPAPDRGGSGTAVPPAGHTALPPVRPDSAAPTGPSTPAPPAPAPAPVPASVPLPPAAVPSPSVPAAPVPSVPVPSVPVPAIPVPPAPELAAVPDPGVPSTSPIAVEEQRRDLSVLEEVDFLDD